MPASGKESANSRGLYSPPGNRFQKEAICHFTGPCVTIAGPGSGKTRVIVERILYLIRYYHMDSSRILVLTFSRAAAIEMQQRFRKRSLEINPNPYPVVFGTFHSVFYRILRESTPEPIAIIPSDRQRRLAASLLTRYGTSAPTADDIVEILSLIADSKRTGTFPEREAGTCTRIVEIARDYNAYLRENNLLDFEDMIGRCEELLRNDPKLLHDWQERFQFLLVDEFQDINAGQFRVLQLLAGTRQNLLRCGR